MVLTLSFYVTLCLTLLFLVLLFIRYWISLSKIKGFPKYPLFSSIIQYQLRRKKSTDPPITCFLFQLLNDMCLKHAEEGLCMSYLRNPVLYVFSEEPIKLFLNSKATITKPVEYKVFEDGLGPGLVTSNGERWRKHRKIINPAFHLGALKEKVPLFNEHALALTKNLKDLGDKASTNYLFAIKRHYFNALSESVFGLKQTEENKHAVLKYLGTIDKLSEFAICRLYQPWLWSKSLMKLFPSGNRILKELEESSNFIKSIIFEMSKKLALNDEADDTKYFGKNLRKSLAYILLQHNLEDPSFTYDDLNAEVTTIMATGYDTVSYTTMWCFFMLGLYPEIQQKAYEEVQSTSNDYVTYEEMNSFAYLEAVIMETLRIYPIVPVVLRSLTEDVQLGKYKVHKGTTIGIMVYSWHRNPDNFPEPEKFDPERFLSGEEIKPWRHIPFAEGNRSCIGKKYALIILKIFLAHVLRNFKITSLDKREDLQLGFNVVLTPLKPPRMLITPRSNTSSL